MSCREVIPAPKKRLPPAEWQEDKSLDTDSHKRMRKRQQSEREDAQERHAQSEGHPGVILHDSVRAFHPNERDDIPTTGTIFEGLPTPPLLCRGHMIELPLLSITVSGVEINWCPGLEQIKKQAGGYEPFVMPGYAYEEAGAAYYAAYLELYGEDEHKLLLDHHVLSQSYITFPPHWRLDREGDHAYRWLQFSFRYNTRAYYRGMGLGMATYAKALGSPSMEKMAGGIDVAGKHRAMEKAGYERSAVTGTCPVPGCGNALSSLLIAYDHVPGTDRAREVTCMRCNVNRINVFDRFLLVEGTAIYERGLIHLATTGTEITMGGGGDADASSSDDDSDDESSDDDGDDDGRPAVGFGAADGAYDDDAPLAAATETAKTFQVSLFQLPRRVDSGEFAVVAIDFETNDIGRDEASADDVAEAYAVQMGLVDRASGAVFSTLIRPPTGVELTDKAIAVHGITPGMLAAAPSFIEMWPSALRWLEAVRDGRKLVLLGHNITMFDRPLLEREQRAVRIPKLDATVYVDTLELAYDLLDRPKAPGAHTLGRLYADATGGPLDNAHDAVADARACIAVLDHLLEQGDQYFEPFIKERVAAAAKASRPRRATRH